MAAPPNSNILKAITSSTFDSLYDSIEGRNGFDAMKKLTTTNIVSRYRKVHFTHAKTRCSPKYSLESRLLILKTIKRTRERQEPKNRQLTNSCPLRFLKSFPFFLHLTLFTNGYTNNTNMLLSFSFFRTQKHRTTDSFENR